MADIDPVAAVRAEWVGRVLGVVVSDGSPGPDPDLLDQLLGLRADMKALMQSGAPEMRALAILLQAATSKTNGGAGDAAAAVQALADAVGKAKGTARVREAGASSSGSIKFRTYQIQWRDVQKTAEFELEALGKDFLALDEVQDDPRYDEMADAVASLTTLVPTFGGTLNEQLNDLMNAGTSRPELVGEVRKTLQSYRKQLDSVPQLQELEAFGAEELGRSYPIHSSLMSILTNIENELPKAA